MTLSIYYPVTQIEALTIYFGFSGTLTCNSVNGVAVKFSGNMQKQKRSITYIVLFSGTLTCTGVNGLSMILRLYHPVGQN